MSWKHMGVWRCSSTILDLGTRWRWVISFMPRPLHPWGNSPRHPLDGRLGEPQSRYRRCGEQKSMACRESNPGHQPIARRYTDCAIPALTVNDIKLIIVKGTVIPVEAVEAVRVARSWGFHIFRNSAHRWRQGCQAYAPDAFYPQEDSWYSFLLEAESTPGS
jgi:hypothetical protein